MTDAATITLRTGQAIPWPPSPTGFAQIMELRRRKVRIGYRNTRGNWRQPIVPLADVATQQLLFGLDNPYNRGLIRRERRYRDVPMPREAQYNPRSTKHRL